MIWLEDGRNRLGLRCCTEWGEKSEILGRENDPLDVGRTERAPGRWQKTHRAARFIISFLQLGHSRPYCLYCSCAVYGQTVLAGGIIASVNRILRHSLIGMLEQNANHALNVS
ncbi:hypothetical protein BO83DRAFT_169496 [Aspergillus eucalypticola CBS 122712]|uniref:Uncharacterized protein n=1 Tax=Aspergillus eucalypticola (strain CBS 122712 / IBT 29274) TaxID=1448314 RepID=A0A317W3K0_ASPEC|nr:uncharacterized protein BO83DRAFT_169496 [Aspergillus eucalypticola CBS 122712]PWY81073.1 hypothetical protein BO83DRAFT_169496 [Aspergillus eucalypticola CBS 122712]